MAKTMNCNVTGARCLQPLNLSEHRSSARIACCAYLAHHQGSVFEAPSRKKRAIVDIRSRNFHCRPGRMKNVDRGGIPSLIMMFCANPDFQITICSFCRFRIHIFADQDFMITS